MGPLLAASLMLGACGDDDLSGSGSSANDSESGTSEGDEGMQGIDDCAIRLDWHAGQGDASSFPTLEMYRADASTRSGYQVELSLEAFPAFADYLQYTDNVLEGLNSLDGFGVNAEVFMRFDGAFDAAALPEASGDAVPSDSVGLVVMPEAGEPYLAPLRVELTDEGETVISRPLWPLPAGARVAYYVKRDFASSGDACVGASDSMRALLDEGSAQMGQAIEALEQLGAIDSSDDLAALQPFVTQTTVDTSFAIAQYIQSLPDEDFELSDQNCITQNGLKYCTATLNAADFRDEDFRVSVDLDAVAPQAPWELTVHAYLPLDASGPLPTVLYGHGLTGDGEQAEVFAEEAAPRGYATVGISALMHGDHPSLMGEQPTGLAALLLFFAADAIAGEIDGLRLRDHFRQSSYDKLYLTRALLAGADFDGDGQSDVDPDALAYHGVSLGAIMGVEFLTLTDAYRGANLVMPGAGLTQIMTDPMGSFELVLVALIPTEYSDGDARRLFSMIQVLLDPADPASYARNLRGDRPAFASQQPDLLVGNVLDDDTVPNSANWTLARAMGNQIVPPTLRPVLGISESAAPPLSQNGNDGSTFGLIQFDVISDGSAATHTNMAFDEVGYAAWFAFLDSLLGDGPTQIIDPYEAIGLDHGG